MIPRAMFSLHRVNPRSLACRERVRNAGVSRSSKVRAAGWLWRQLWRFLLPVHLCSVLPAQELLAGKGPINSGVTHHKNR